MAAEDPKDIVRRGYDTASVRYDEAYGSDTKYQPWLSELRPGGLFIATTGYWAWTGVEEKGLGGGAAMWWSHADVDTYRSWIARAGLSIEREDFVPEGDGGHALFWAQMPDTGES